MKESKIAFSARTVALRELKYIGHLLNKKRGRPKLKWSKGIETAKENVE